MKTKVRSRELRLGVPAKPGENGNGKARRGSIVTDPKSESETLEQPPVEEILDSRPLSRARDWEQLDRSTLLRALTALKKGDFSFRLPADLEGMDGKIADTFNDVIELNERMSRELERLGRVVGKEGKISQRASMGEVTGAWKDSVDCVNQLISDLVHPTCEMARMIGAVAKGDLSQSLARELQSQQEELQQTNAELEEKAKLLADQNVEVERKNKEVEQARQALEEKAKQPALTSKCKSEFLANMSHELRTPLNSLLILSDQLSKNTDGNLTSRQVEFAHTIHASGIDLLTLINDILDLSKIESGTVIVDVGDIGFRDLHDYVERTFRHVAESKKLDFEVDIAPHVPRSISTDAKRLQQILKNLLSNAFKFTDKGRVALEITTPTDGWSMDHEMLNKAKSVIALTVRDTGIGIPPEKQQIIFEAFQQADGSTSRKYGGTGLGLAISREIAKLLGGEIKLVSTPGEGSTFTLYLPQHYSMPRAAARRQQQAPATPASSAPAFDAVAPPSPDADALMTSDITAPSRMPIIGDSAAATIDDSADLQVGDHVLLIVENDSNFARFLVDMAHDNLMKAVVASRGSTALHLARQIKPHAITLDINLPDIDGWRVLDRLKDDETTRHIPVQIITTEEERERGLRMGAMGVLTKPIKTRQTLDEAFARIRQFPEPHTRHVMVIEADESTRDQTVQSLAGDDAQIHAYAAAVDAIQPVANARKLSLDVSVDPAIGMVFGDPDRLQQVVWNLLTNAAKFTSPGGRVNIRAQRHDGSSVRLCVRDTGIGISRQFLPHVFDRFRQADSTSTRAHGGLGIGLSIVRHIVELHGGSVLADSDGEGRGAAFSVILPMQRKNAGESHATEEGNGRHASDDAHLAVLQAMARSRAADQMDQVDLSQARILLVDDEADARELLSEVLRRRGAEVMSAESARHAMRILSDFRPHVLLSDIAMPDEDGYQFIQCVRRLPVDQGGHTPAIALTAYVRPEDAERALAAGFQAHLPKPVEPTALIDAIDQALRCVNSLAASHLPMNEQYGTSEQMPLTALNRSKGQSDCG